MTHEQVGAQVFDHVQMRVERLNLSPPNTYSDPAQ